MGWRKRIEKKADGCIFKSEDGREDQRKQHGLT